MRLLQGSKTRSSESGATATEYGLLVGFIAMAILLGVATFGNALNSYYDTLAAAVGNF
ncbi:Flp family type IVb pilin [Nocardioides sp. Root151]|uniref:Flp family type IVb pilin n=1 Tax=Nocardioides sp. Root151 TaxID=1736475 RepID=UPI00190FD186|nr:Flp family type IVb pilin [Nocardioides sp. Root151]